MPAETIKEITECFILSKMARNENKRDFWTMVAIFQRGQEIEKFVGDSGIYTCQHGKVFLSCQHGKVFFLSRATLKARDGIY